MREGTERRGWMDVVALLLYWGRGANAAVYGNNVDRERSRAEKAKVTRSSEIMGNK